jgi:hypothetical protein
MSAADVEERRMPAPQDAIGEEVLEVRKPSLTRRMSMEKRIMRRGSSHILIDVLSDSVEVELEASSNDGTLPSGEHASTSPRFSASASSIAASSSAKDATSSSGFLAEPNRPGAHHHLDKHRITIAAVSPRLRRKPTNTLSGDKGAAGRPALAIDGGKAEPQQASYYYEPQLRCGVYSMQGRRKAMEDAHTVELGSGSYAPRSAGGAAATSEEATAASGAKESKPDLGRPSRAGVADELSNALNMPSSPDSLCAFFGVYDGMALSFIFIYIFLLFVLHFFNFHYYIIIFFYASVLRGEAGNG